MDIPRSLYTLLVYAVTPLLPLRLWLRGRRESGYRAAIGERFGRYRRATAARSQRTANVFWVHAVSLGETRAAIPIVHRLRKAYPQAQILLTHMTATGRETGRALLGENIVQAWLPYDLPFAVRSFLSHFQPTAGLLLETELWPNLIAECRRSAVPVYLVNARLSERSARGYQRVLPLARTMLQSLTGIAAQTAADAARFVALGAPPPIVTGNLKFDVQIPAAALRLAGVFMSRIGAERRVWAAVSTREGEEALILEALKRRPLPPSSLLLLVPRHPQRFDDVAKLLRERRIRFLRRSSDSIVAPEVEVVLGDSVGEMAAYLSSALFAFVGGSLLAYGGQNLIEPLALGRPVVIGPHTFNFAEAARGAVAAGAALEVADADELVSTVHDLLGDDARRARMAGAALAFHRQHAGAADRTWAWLEPQLEAISPKARG